MRRFIILFTPVLLFLSCNKDYPDVETLRIASVLWMEDINPEEGSEPVYRYYIKRGSEMDWSLGMADGQIRDFTYEEGYEWLIKIEVREFDNPPADAPGAEYKLKKILSRDKINSEGLPEI